MTLPVWTQKRNSPVFRSTPRIAPSKLPSTTSCRLTSTAGAYLTAPLVLKLHRICPSKASRATSKPSLVPHSTSDAVETKTGEQWTKAVVGVSQTFCPDFALSAEIPPLRRLLAY